jgi:hypothetical protein
MMLSTLVPPAVLDVDGCDAMILVVGSPWGIFIANRVRLMRVGI